MFLLELPYIVLLLILLALLLPWVLLKDRRFVIIFVLFCLVTYLVTHFVFVRIHEPPDPKTSTGRDLPWENPKTAYKDDDIHRVQKLGFSSLVFGAT